MFSFLNKPYPHTDNRKKNFWVSLCIGGFVAFFLIVFQPFDISLWLDPDKKLKLAGYGIVSFIIPVLFGFAIQVIPAREREDNWRVWKEMLSVTTIVLLIAGGNMVYSEFIGIGRISLMGYFKFIGITFSVGFFPITLSVITKHNRFLKLNRETAAEINMALEEKTQPLPQPVSGKLVLVAENEKDKLEMEPADLLYIESADNYSMVHYLAKGALNKTLVRGSLKRMESQCGSFPEIMRCHRAFIINIKNVTHIEGNAAGYKLSVNGTDTTVPVSRNYGSSITTKLKAIS